MELLSITGKELLKVLPKGWKISLSWHQILMSDVAFEIDFEKQLVSIGYNQNLTYWSKNLIEDITTNGILNSFAKIFISLEILLIVSYWDLPLDIGFKSCM